MLYLEDYLEMIEHLPQELRDRFTDMRELDLQVHNEMDNLDEQVKVFFSNAKRMKLEQRDQEFIRLKQDYYKTLDESEEKLTIATQVYDLVDKYLRRLDSELQKFKLELEADNAGITEILERRSLELDVPSISAAVHGRDRKRSALNNVNNNSSNDVFTTGHSHLHNNGSGGSLAYVHGSISNLSNSINHHNASNRLSTRASFSGTSSTPLANGALGREMSNVIGPAISNQASSINTGNNNMAKLGYSTAIAAAASQAIAATQQMQQGRRTASLKASYEAINSGLQNISCDFSSAFRDQINTSGTLNATSNSCLETKNTCLAGPSGTGNSGINSSLDPGYHRHAKRNRASSQFSDLEENGNANSDWNFESNDPNEPRYCLCNQISYGDMVACDNEECDREWFHYGCVNISQPPKGKWYCPNCINLMKKKTKKEKL